MKYLKENTSKQQLLKVMYWLGTSKESAISGNANRGASESAIGCLHDWLDI